MDIEILVDWEKLKLKKPKRKVEKDNDIESRGRVLNDIKDINVDSSLFEGKLLNLGVYLQKDSPGGRYIYEGKEIIYGKTKRVEKNTFPQNKYFWANLIYKFKKKEAYPIPLNNFFRNGLNFYADINNKQFKPLGTVDGYSYDYKNLNSFYNKPELALFRSKINGQFGINFFDSYYRFQSFNTEDKTNFKITEYPTYESPEKNFRFKNNKIQRIAIVPRRYETLAFWYDNYLYTTWFTSWINPLSRYARVEDFIPMHPVPFGYYQNEFNVEIANYVPPQLKDNFENTNAPSDYSIEFDLYQKALRFHDPREFEVFNLFFMILWAGSSQPAYLTRVLAAKEGDLVGVIEQKGKYLYVWRRKDEVLPEDLDYLAAGSMLVSFLGDDKYYSYDYVRGLKFDI